VRCPKCDSEALGLRRVSAAAWWHLVRWCHGCRATVGSGQWVPHGDVWRWGYLWVDEVPTLAASVDARQMQLTI
jgi:hypothetical protein